MNSEERRLLNEFLQQLKQAKGVTKDPEAASLIAEAAAEQPDALYLLVQKALLQERALTAANAQIARLQRQAEPPESSRFLGNDPWAPARAAAPAPSSSGGGLAGFLGTAATAAAGIAAGAFLFRGIESLLGHTDAGGFLDAARSHPDPADNLMINEEYEPEHGSQRDFLHTGFEEDSDDGFDGYDDDGDTLNV